MIEKTIFFKFMINPSQWNYQMSVLVVQATVTVISGGQQIACQLYTIRSGRQKRQDG